MTEVCLRLELIAAEYRVLTRAVERALLDDEARPETKQTVPVPAEMARAPMPPTSGRAVGTSDDAMGSCAATPSDRTMGPGPQTSRPGRRTLLAYTPAGMELPWHR